MPFLKDILSGWKQKIIPVSRLQEVLSLLATAPFAFSAVRHWTIRKVLLIDNAPYCKFCGNSGIDVKVLLM